VITVALRFRLEIETKRRIDQRPSRAAMHPC
jgi:hypothetical protein